MCLMRGRDLMDEAIRAVRRASEAQEIVYPIPGPDDGRLSTANPPMTKRVSCRLVELYANTV